MGGPGSSLATRPCAPWAPLLVGSAASAVVTVLTASRSGPLAGTVVLLGSAALVSSAGALLPERCTLASGTVSTRRWGLTRTVRLSEVTSVRLRSSRRSHLRGHLVLSGPSGEVLVPLDAPGAHALVRGLSTALPASARVAPEARTVLSPPRRGRTRE